MPANDRTPTRQSIGWIRDMSVAKQLDLNPPYQRRSVWNEDYKQYFIDTTLRNYLIPPVFVSVEINENGTSIYHVVDGKQRLLAIIEFLSDESPLSHKYIYKPEFVGKYFSELDVETKRGFYGYFLPFEFFNDITNVEV